MSDGTQDTLRERSDRNTALLRLLLERDRRLLAAGIVLLLFLAVSLVALAYPDVVGSLRTGDPTETLFQALTAATVTGVTLVLTLNQLVISQELGAVGDQRERMEAALTFRSDAADTLGTPASPPEPAAFLRALVDVAGETADTLETSLDTDDDQLRDRVESLTGSTRENAETVHDELNDARFGDYGVLSAALNFNYSWKLYAARRLREAHADELGEEARDALDEFIETLELFGPAREHFKTLYFQWELVDLSRAMLAAAIPALVVAVSTLLFFDPAKVTGATLGVPHVVLGVSAAAAVSLLPFALLLSYVLRIATVTKRTLSIGPFILRETDRETDEDWE
ncbi:hypothetical protein [Natronomonas sp. EA1]|uniref:hypothetical protein n=1 Tax=Natronomonas sp. EA1 TaxID=3421655 RepID=UPI003EBF1927